ncbi:MAG: multidrug effflux MFS transporter [Campylobacterota bacterium]
MKHQLPKYFIFLLASLTAISPFAIDTYLPAMLSMSEYFNSSIGSIEITLSIYLIGLSIGQLIGGPLSDRFGRKVMINLGLGLYITASFMIANAQSLEMLWAFRFLQAIGGGFAIVNVAAIVRDNFEGKENAKTLSFIAMIMMVAPMIAPAVGSLILSFASWKAIFLFLALYASLVLVWIQLIPETSAKTKSKNVLKDYLSILTHKIAPFLAFSAAFAMAGMFVFITKSSFIYMEYFGLDKNLFTLFFAINVATLIGFNRLNISLLAKHDRDSIVKAGVWVQIAASSLLIIFALLLPTLYVIVPLIMVFVGSLGFIFGNVISLVLGFFPKISATANAMVGVLGFATAALMGFLSTLLPDTALAPVFMMMLLTAILSFITFTIAKKRILSLHAYD